LDGQGTRKTGRFATEDVIPEDAANDVDFQRAVQKLEDQTHGQAGFLFSKGAFDKGDFAYMREEEDRQRHVEEAMAEQELTEFAAARLRVEQEEKKRKEKASVNAPLGKKGSKEETYR